MGRCECRAGWDQTLGEVGIKGGRWDGEIKCGGKDIECRKGVKIVRVGKSAEFI